MISFHGITAVCVTYHPGQSVTYLTGSNQALWEDELAVLMRKLGRRTDELRRAGKSEVWKLAITAARRARTTVTNRWLAATLHMGNLS